MPAGGHSRRECFIAPQVKQLYDPLPGAVATTTVALTGRQNARRGSLQAKKRRPNKRSPTQTFRKRNGEPLTSKSRRIRTQPVSPSTPLPGYCTKVVGQSQASLVGTRGDAQSCTRLATYSLPRPCWRSLLAMVVCDTPRRLPSCRLLGCSWYRRSSTAFSKRPRMSSRPPSSENSPSGCGAP